MSCCRVCVIYPLSRYVFPRQWGSTLSTNGLITITYPIALTEKPWLIIPTEGNPSGWNTSPLAIAIPGADLETATNTQANILSHWVYNGGTVAQQGESIKFLIVGK